MVHTAVRLRSESTTHFHYIHPIFTNIYLLLSSTAYIYRLRRRSRLYTPNNSIVNI
jgi:hypothetical protein